MLYTCSVVKYVVAYFHNNNNNKYNIIKLQLPCRVTQIVELGYVSMSLIMFKVAKILLLLTVSFVIGFFLGAHGLEYYESNTFRPWAWKVPPVVLNCYGEELNEVYVIRGID